MLNENRFNISKLVISANLRFDKKPSVQIESKVFFVTELNSLFVWIRNNTASISAGMFHMKKFLTLFLISLCSLFLFGCYDVINQPLSGQGGESAIFSIAGKWVEKDQKTRLTIMETAASDQFTFSYEENGRVWKGMVEASYYDQKIALNLDLLSLTLDDKKLIWADEPLFLLIGAYFKSDKLYIIEADMQKFRKGLANYFYANQFETGKFCVANQGDLCKKSFTNKYVLSPKNNAKFNREFNTKFNKIFPKAKALVFESVED